MSELLDAAKAVIEYWDAEATNNLQDEVIDKLRAAVERAEKQETVGFDEWWVHADTKGDDWEARDSHEGAWTAAQQAERERIKDIVAELLDPVYPWIHYSTLLEEIDASEDS